MYITAYGDILWAKGPWNNDTELGVWAAQKSVDKHFPHIA